MSGSDENISLRDIYEAVQNTEQKMNRMEDRLMKNIENNTVRLKILEDWKNRALGVIGVLSLFFSMIATYIWSKIVGE